ncbi:MAG: glycosyltransferase [Chloroflexi bacterium]|nr:glycosyltransferase [Chloroflexota bacterium]
MDKYVVSVIATVKNEAHNIERVIDSLLAQTRLPDEIVLVDGGSTDGTVATVKRFVSQGAPIKLLLADGSNISQGRNLAIRNARGEIIASTDAGVVLHPEWLANLLAGFRGVSGDSREVDVVSGFFVADCSTAFETAMGATVLPGLGDVDPKSFLPSSRSVAFRRSAWESIGGYPEWLDYCEDLIFDLDLRKAGCRYVFAPNAVVHFKPRGTLRSFARQYFLYARGDGKAGLWPKRHAVRYLTYLVAPLAMVLGFWYKILWLLVFLGAAAYLRRPYQRLLPKLTGYSLIDITTAILLVPVIRIVGDLSKMAGYPAGVWWRLKNR